MTRKALGRGLGALLSADRLALANEETNEFPIDLIDPSASQPRSFFDGDKLAELAQSVRTNGIVQPLLIRKKGERFELIAGERRWRAAQLAGLTKVPAVIRDVSDEKVLEIALIENIQREDLNPIEEARAYRKLIDKVGLTQETVAEQVGRDRSYVTNYLRLLRLPEDLQHLLQAGKLTTGHARALLGVDQATVQRRIARKVIDQDLSVRATERLVKRAADLLPTRTVTSKRQSRDPNVQSAENKLRRHLGTQVRIVRHANNQGGKIEVDFYSEADLERLYGLLVK